MSGPIHWPSLGADEAAAEWDALRRWVEDLVWRYPNGVRLPDCWWRHDDVVELLAALRDHERGCFVPSAPATAAMDWQRAWSDVENRLEVWVKRLPCAVPGRGHRREGQYIATPDGWSSFVAEDVAQRRESEPDPQEH